MTTIPWKKHFSGKVAYLICTFLQDINSPKTGEDTYHHFIEYLKKKKQRGRPPSSGHFYKTRTKYWNLLKQYKQEDATAKGNFIVRTHCIEPLIEKEEKKKEETDNEISKLREENSYLHWKLAGLEKGWFEKWLNEEKGIL